MDGDTEDITTEDKEAASESQKEGTSFLEDSTEKKTAETEADKQSVNEVKNDWTNDLGCK